MRAYVTATSNKKPDSELSLLFNNELTNRLDMDNTIEVIDSTDNEEVVAPEAMDLDATELESSLEETIDVAKLIEQNKKLFARAKTAEEKLKEVKPQQPAQVQKANINKKESEYLTREEAILIAKGEDETALAKLKAIAKGNGVSLLEAQKDEMFVAWKALQEKEQVSKKAKLGASKGSGMQTREKQVSEMSREEHMKFVMDTFGK